MLESHIVHINKYLFQNLKEILFISIISKDFLKIDELAEKFM